MFDVHPGCLNRIAAVVRLIASTGATQSGREQLASSFHLCSPPKLSPDTHIVQDLSDWFTDAIETIPQLNYPYPVPPFTFGWPVNQTCKTLASGAGADAGAEADMPADGNAVAALLAAASEITASFYGSGNTSQCFDGVGQGGIPGGGPVPNMVQDPTDHAWGYQSCTETLHKFSGRGVRNFSFELAPVAAVCADTFNAEPDFDWPGVHYGGYGIPAGLTGASNIIFSEGLLDPWHGGGFLKQVSGGTV